MAEKILQDFDIQVITRDIKAGVAFVIDGFRIFVKNGIIMASHSRKGECPLSDKELSAFVEFAVKLNKPIMRCN